MLTTTRSKVSAVMHLCTFFSFPLGLMHSISVAFSFSLTLALPVCLCYQSSPLPSAMLSVVRVPHMSCIIIYEFTIAFLSTTIV